MKSLHEEIESFRSEMQLFLDVPYDAEQPWDTAIALDTLCTKYPRIKQSIEDIETLQKTFRRSRVTYTSHDTRAYIPVAVLKYDCLLFKVHQKEDNRILVQLFAGNEDWIISAYYSYNGFQLPIFEDFLVAGNPRHIIRTYRDMLFRKELFNSSLLGIFEEFGNIQEHFVATLRKAIAEDNDHSRECLVATAYLDDYEKRYLKNECTQRD